MDLGTESSKYPGDVTQGTSEEAPSNLPTVLIAVGAVGGAVLVVLTIAVCRYCLGRRKGLKSEVRGDYGEGENFDINVHTLSDIPEDAVPTLVLSGGQLGVPDQSTQRRVSFQGVDLLDDDDSPLRRDSNKRRRYTEGDFHHLKKARLNKTLGLPAILKSASVDSPRPARETYPLLTITHADEMADEPESPKETDTESPGPDSRRSDRRKSSEVSVPVEVHRGSEPSKEGSGEQSAVRQFFRKLQKHASLDAVLPSQQKIQQWKTSRPWKSFDCQVLSSHPRPLLRQRAVSDPVERDPGKHDFTLDRKTKNSPGRFQSTESFQTVVGAEDITAGQNQKVENRTTSLSTPDNKDLSRHIWQLRTTLELDTASQHSAESPNGDNLSSPEQEGAEGRKGTEMGGVSPAVATASAEPGPAGPRSSRRPFSRQASEERETEGGGGEDPPSPNTRLLMMQADSGYVSIEKQPKLVHQKEGIRFTFDDEDLESMAAVPEVPITSPTVTSPRVTVQDFSQEQEKQQEHGQAQLSPVPLSPKSAAERRKSFTSDGKAEPVLMELEASAEGNSSHRPASPSKQLVVKGKFRLASAKERYEYPRRDYSIDEKTDAVFNEFLRQDVMFEDTLSVRSRRRHHRKRHSESLSEQANHSAQNRSPERHRLPISGSNTLPHDKSKNKGIMRRLVPDNHDRSMHKVVTERTDDRVSVESGNILPRRATSPNTSTSSEKTDTGRNTL
ncbi:PREDICTED: voltage-dependent calcium channel beta subunit-associated regulatory protein-like [Branchiostoma belcheri]|uniref:Voltage-dependent calcium channel beta subunit-associated regulatory protein-like n=1 Tax=Branchiostoma belcheri TaxID=7741 RepID=A0A6P4Y7I8_BRABE|nr:PREDICTED: voltage-dependent calcium channel beta subunit-associated regulatory protein-like [Branchiostoma belcheri]XP_019618312.1 PREDICTED: voltage-dependent calcium channel beta subunit-associated regulatory protein-like [Branchiostoma belcheri]XP_019618314.1 PREDICTED: voltage-dependent calcium channel beta subunit-associated regulatory protein-like [Branchiostoma belcheri]